MKKVRQFSTGKHTYVRKNYNAIKSCSHLQTSSRMNSKYPNSKSIVGFFKNDNLPLSDPEPVESRFFECPYRGNPVRLGKAGDISTRKREVGILFFPIRRCTTSSRKYEFMHISTGKFRHNPEFFVTKIFLKIQLTENQKKKKKIFRKI